MSVVKGRRRCLAAGRSARFHRLAGVICLTLTLALALPVAAAPPREPPAQAAPAWQPVASGALYPLAVHGNDRLYVSSNGRTYRSLDHGVTWAPLVGDTLWPRDVVDSPLDPNLLFAAGEGANPFLARSRDGGATWTVLPPPPEQAAGSRVSEQPVVARDGSVWTLIHVVEAASATDTTFSDRLVVSRDAGDTWTIIPQRFDTNRFRISPADPNVIWVDGPATGERIWWRSRDGGQTWLRLAQPAFDPSRANLSLELQLDPFAGETAWIMDDNRLYRTDNSGATWREVAAVGASLWAGTSVGAGLRLIFDETGAGRLYVAYGAGSTDARHPSGLAVSDDGGTTWQHATLPPPEFFGHLAVSAPPGGQSALFVGLAHGIFASRDAGQTWSAAVGFNAVAFRQVRRLSGGWLALHQPSSGYLRCPAAGGDSLLPTSGPSRSDDLGQTWRTISPPVGSGTEPLLEVVADPRVPLRVFAVTSRTVFRSDDDGGAWHEGAEPFPANRRYAGFALDPFDPDTLWLAWRACGAPESRAAAAVALWRSRDAGRSWEPVALPAEYAATVSGIGLDPVRPGRIHVAARDLLTSDDGGATWRRWPVGDQPDAPEVLSVLVDPVSTDTVWAGTTRGLWVSRDAGTTFQPEPVVPEDAAVRVMAHPRDPRRFYVTTYQGPYRPMHLFRSLDSGAEWLDLIDPIKLAPAPMRFPPLDPQFHLQISIVPGFPDWLFAASANGTWVLEEGRSTAAQ